MLSIVATAVMAAAALWAIVALHLAGSAEETLHSICYAVAGIVPFGAACALYDRMIGKQ